MQFDGGGFMNSGNTGSNSQTVFTGDRVSSVRSLLIRQIQDVSEPEPEAGILIDGNQVDRVRLAGIVQDVQPQQNSVSITMYDVTGQLTFRQFFNSDDEQPAYETNKYAAAFGTLRLLGGKIAFTATRVDQSVSTDYIMNHEMHALREHLHYTGKQPFGVARSSAGKATLQPVDYAELRAKTLTILPENEPGLTLDYLASALGLDEDSIRKIIEDLETSNEIWECGSSAYARIGAIGE